jgi:hypothetical protein
MNAARWIASAVAAGVTAVAVAACGPVTGGGWMESSVGGAGRATFGFDLTCNPNSHEVGTFSYKDKLAGINVNGTLTDAMSVQCQNGDTPVTVIRTAPIQFQPCNGGICRTGFADFTVTDGQTNGHVKNDRLGVTLHDADGFDVYDNEGPVLGGNLTTS